MCVCVSMQLHTHRPSANLSSWSRVHVCQPHFFSFFLSIFFKSNNLCIRHSNCASSAIWQWLLLFMRKFAYFIKYPILLLHKINVNWVWILLFVRSDLSDFVKFPLSLHLFTLRVHNSGSYRNNNETNTTCNFSNWFLRSIEYLSI